MKKIRKGTFETNSSSMHSIVVEGMEETKEFNPVTDENGYYHIKLDDYSDLDHDLRTVEEIISFAASWIVENGFFESSFSSVEDLTMEDIRKFEGFGMLEKIIMKHSNVKGIILEEVGSASAESLDFDERQMLNAGLLEKLIFGKDSYVRRDIYNI